MFSDTAVLSFSDISTKDITLVDALSNGFFNFKFSPFFYFLASYSGGGYLFYVLASLLCTFILLFYAFRPATGWTSEFLIKCLVVIAAFATYFSLRGVSLIVVNSLFAIAALIFSLKTRSLRSSPSIFHLGLLTISSLLVISAFNQSAIILFVAALWLYSDREFFSSGINRVYLTLLSLFIFFSTQSPLPELPDYPRGARLVGGYTINQGIDPIIGAQVKTPLINREYVYGFGFFLIITLLIRVVMGLWRGTLFQSKKSAVLFFLCGMSFLLRCHPATYTLSPFSVLIRIIPNLSTFPIESLFVALVSIDLASWFLTDGSKKSNQPGQPSVACIYALFLCVPLASMVNSMISQRNLLNHFQKVLQGVTANTIPRDVVLSPSLFILLRYQIFDSKRIEELSVHDREKGNPIDLLKAADHTEFSHNQKGGRLLLDSKAKRWTPQLPEGGQRGGEKFLLRFSEPLEIKALDLSVPHFPTDFPRGLEISTAEECSLERFHPSQILFREPVWMGSINITDKGFPYFSGQDEVEIHFKHPYQIKCLVVSQIGDEPFFDWSIEHVYGYR